MGVLYAKVAGSWIPISGTANGGGGDVSGPNPDNALGIVEVGQVTLPANQSSPAIDTEITTRLNYVLSSSRRYRLVLYIAAQQNGGYAMGLHSGGSSTGMDAWITNPDYRWGSGTAEFLVTGNDVNQAFSIKIGNTQGTPVIYHGASDLWYLEDLGPVSAPAPPITLPPGEQMMVGAGAFPTDANGDATIDLPTGAKITAAVGNGTQPDYPMHITANLNNGPIGGSTAVFRVRNLVGGAPAASTWIGLSYMITYTYGELLRFIQDGTTPPEIEHHTE